MRGLVNLGNTCYFNTAIQCLAHVPPLTVHLFSAELSGCSCDITKEYKKVVTGLFEKDKKDPVNPVDLLRAFQKKFPEFSDGQQHDAQEVILHLIDVFERSLGKEFITSLFNGEEIQETRWSGDGCSRTSSPFTTILLDVTEPSRLSDLLKDRAEPTSIENYKDSDGTVHNKATIHRRVERWPKFTCFSFSMYDYKFPIEIPLEFEGRKLYACIIHHGHARGGHYALLVRRYSTWYIKDDEQVTEVKSPNDTIRGEFYQCWYRPLNSLT